MLSGKSRFRAAGLMCVMLALGASAAVKAETVMPPVGPDGSITVFQTSVLVSGRQMSGAQFTIPMAGTVTATLRDLKWPEALSALSFRLADATGLLVKMNIPGVLTFDLDAPGRFFALLSGTAKGAMDLGMYSLDIKLTPFVAPVPLPAAVWLLLGGLATLVGLRRRTALQPAH